MANPNIVNVTSIYGKTNGMAVGTSAANVVSNASSSGTIVKVNDLIVSNVDGTNNADVTVEVYKNQSTAYHIAKTVTVPADATLVVITKDTAIYLEENDSIRVYANTAGDLEAVCSYEIIS
jgi:uncharacterized protein YjdB